MAEAGTGRVEVFVDLERRRLTSRFSGFIRLDDALKAKELYSDGLRQLGGRSYTALTNFSGLRVLAPEATQVFESMVAEASQHNCIRAARVVADVKSVAKMQLERLQAGDSSYESRFFETEDEAVRYLSEKELQA